MSAPFSRWQPPPGNDERPVKERSWDGFGNAERLIDRHADHLRWIIGEKPRWAVFDGQRWLLPGAVTLAKRKMRETLEVLPDEEALLYDDAPGRKPDGKPVASKRTQFLAWVSKQRDAKAINTALEVASTHESIAAKLLDFDPRIDVITLPNCTIDLPEHQDRPHDPADMITRLMGTRYDPTAQCPLWMRYLEMNLAEDVRAYIQRAAGYTLTGRNNEKKMFYLYGVADTGKTLLVEILSALFGEYGVTAAEGALRPKKSDSGPSNDINDMRKARYVTTSETRPGQEMDEALVKRLTGGDRQQTRGMFEENSGWKPECVLWVASNQYPRITGDDDAIWGRIRIVKFVKSYPEGHPERDNLLKEKIIAAELPGVLNWALEGLCAYLRSGLAEPTEVTQWSDEFRGDSDGVVRFIGEQTDGEAGLLWAGEKQRVDRTELHTVYKRWCLDEGIHPLSGTRFYARLATKGWHTVASNGKRYIDGLGVNPDRSRQWQDACSSSKGWG